MKTFSVALMHAYLIEYVNFRAMEASVDELSMAEIRSLEETVTDALAAIRVILHCTHFF